MARLKMINYDLETEKVLLEAILLQPSVLEEIEKMIQPEHLSPGKHRHIY